MITEEQGAFLASLLDEPRITAADIAMSDWAFLQGYAGTMSKKDGAGAVWTHIGLTPEGREALEELTASQQRDVS